MVSCRYGHHFVHLLQIFHEILQWHVAFYQEYSAMIHYTINWTRKYMISIINCIYVLLSLIYLFKSANLVYQNPWSTARLFTCPCTIFTSIYTPNVTITRSRHINRCSSNLNAITNSHQQNVCIFHYYYHSTKLHSHYLASACLKFSVTLTQFPLHGCAQWYVALTEVTPAR